MDKELEIMYKWLRGEVLVNSKIPQRIQWYNRCLLKDMDERLTELEKKDE